MPPSPTIFDNREEIEEDIQRNDEIAEKFRAQYPSNASQQGRVMVTMDSDYLILAAQIATHAGIAYAKPGTRSVGQLIQKLRLIHDVLTPAEMENHIEYL